MPNAMQNPAARAKPTPTGFKGSLARHTNKATPALPPMEASKLAVCGRLPLTQRISRICSGTVDTRVAATPPGKRLMA